MPTKAENEARRKERNKKIADRARKNGKPAYLAVATGQNEPKPGRPRKKRQSIGDVNERRKKIITCGQVGGRTATGKSCSMSAGAGTDHPGTGRCFRHGGLEPKQKPAPAHSRRRLPGDRNHIVVDKNAPKDLNDAKQLLGIPIEMNPMDALMWCVRLTAGEIVWYSDRMAELREDQWIEDTFVGKQLHMFARNRTIAIDRLAKYSKWAIDGGIAERAMRLAEAYGEQLFQLLHGVLTDLDLSPDQRQRAPEIITRHLMALEKRSILNSTNQLVAGEDPKNVETIIIEDAEIVK